MGEFGAPIYMGGGGPSPIKYTTIHILAKNPRVINISNMIIIGRILDIRDNTINLVCNCCYAASVCVFICHPSHKISIDFFSEIASLTDIEFGVQIPCNETTYKR